MTHELAPKQNPRRGVTRCLARCALSTLALSALLLAASSAIACSPAMMERVQFSADTGEATAPPTAPVARVVNIQRGRPARRGENTCVEVSSVTIAVRDDSLALPYYFAFREAGGTAPDLIFDGGLYAGGINGEGERQFTFYWPEISHASTGLDLQVEITPYTRSGIPGPSAVIRVSDVGD